MNRDCTNNRCSVLGQLDCKWCKDWQERAAIREEAPMSREDAERLAREDLEKWEKEENKHGQRKEK